MDKFATLEPVRLYNPPAAPSPTTTSNRYSLQLSRPPAAAPSHNRTKALPSFQLIGRLPVESHILVLTYLSVPDLPAYACCSRALSNLAKDDRVWDARWSAFVRDFPGLPLVLDAIEDNIKQRNAIDKTNAPPTLLAESIDDDFGDFASVNVQADEMGVFVGAFSPTPRSTFTFNTLAPTGTAAAAASSSRALYIRAHNLLKTLTPTLSSPPHAILSNLFPAPPPPLSHQAHALRLLNRFLSTTVRPLRNWETLRGGLRIAIGRFQDSLLSEFEVADGEGNEQVMRAAADASWQVWDGTDEWELGKVWVEKREIFYERRWKPLENFTKDSQLDFTPMEGFMSQILSALQKHGSRAVVVFPTEANVLISFAQRLANEVIGDYIGSILQCAKHISDDIYLKASAATFKLAYRMVDIIAQVAATNPDLNMPRTKAEDVVFRMFEPNMDEYLDQEIKLAKESFDKICRAWEKQLSEHTGVTLEHARFLGQNADQVKRNVIASFTDVLILPVTIVPKTVGRAVGAVPGLHMLNPWGAQDPNAKGPGFPFARMPSWHSDERDREGYVRGIGKNESGMLFDIGTDEEEDEKPVAGADRTPRSSLTVSTTDESTSTAPTSIESTRVSTPLPKVPLLDNLEVLLSLDVTADLIHADRDSIKRVETFTGYPAPYGHRVRGTIEEIFVLLLKALGERHIKPGFQTAIDQMKSHKPAEHDDTKSVAPLLQFFELVHVGDTMQSMVQVYFDKELAPHIDRTDFMNAVVREKKHFEEILDDSVASGLNAATDALMNQVEHIIQKLTKPREYYPMEDGPMDLGPTQGCKEAIKCLQMHCQLLKGTTSREVLEVFYQEVGIRLIAILQKHIKRQIISLNGGFLVIADLNAYHTFITSLRVPSITSEFAYLKMLGHVYVVEDAKDLAQIVRDVTRYGGAYRPEDIYEYIQRRSDWKKIEKTVDKTMYNLSFKEDCIVC